MLEAFDQAKKQGKTRFIGFTGHKGPAFHLKMIEIGYPFDTVQIPLNPFDAGFHSFEKQVLPVVNERGMAALGTKSMGGDGQPILHGNLAIARGFKPMAPEKMQALRERCKTFATDGHRELYKPTKRYDGGVGREQHGYPPPRELPF